MDMMIAGKSMREWLDSFPLLEQIRRYEPVHWLNPEVQGEQLNSKTVNKKDIAEAAERWQRFAPLLIKLFPELSENNGIIESPLRKLDNYKNAYLTDVLGEESNFYLKCDHLLPVAGSIKARGGMYEVLKHAETLALQAGLLTEGDNYQVLASKKSRQFFNNHSIGVGSTGNLALSIGIIGTALGFHVDVHMSSDAKQWKKDLLRQHGANVHEYRGDFSEAITAGREKTLQNPSAYFIDDEDSKDLFLGYSVAAAELQKQLEAEGIAVNEQHPLVVYLPCGVGGAPGGIAYGLKQLFGEHVHCFFVEPTHSPSVLIGLLTGLDEQVSVQDFGLDNRTAADGLAVGRPSSFASAISRYTVSGIYTENDQVFYQLGYQLVQSEELFVEPSAAAGLSGPKRLQKMKQSLLKKAKSATHIAWSTGGSLVPEAEREKIYQKGKRFSE
ncbi:D-serine ammonia-lyase [Sediminibacillus albus]|uniref:Probable D-serine dehydratase n=2 Tax=Sediminibacillus albus TaxID=407036 RepID=A0A1G8WPD9_9BACI|nr:D-serine ammonia-lyase [Sediminibacillus albus]